MRIENNVLVEIFDVKTKKLVETRETHNLVTTLGLKWVRDLIGGTEVRASAIVLGTGLAAATVSDTALAIQVYSRNIDRRIGTLSPPVMTQKIFVAGADANGNDISEIGLVRGPLLIARAIITPITKTALVELTISHQITVA